LLLAGKYNFSGKLNALALNDGPDVKDCTVFGNTAKNRKQGLPLITAALAGFFDQEPDEYFSDHTLANIPMTIAPTPAEGGPAYSFLSRSAEYQFGGEVGEMFKFSVKAESVGTKLIRGRILENGVTARVASGDGSVIELDAPTALQYLYGALHVTGAATVVGDTLDVIIESDDVVTFLGTPETQISFTQALGNGGGTYEWAVPIAAGAITDTFWRCSWVIAGASPSFNLVNFMGII